MKGSFRQHKRKLHNCRL